MKGSRRKADPSWDYVARSLLAGGVAGCVAKTAIAPLDRVKILFQGHNRSFAQERGNIGGTFRTLQRIFAQEGMRGLWKGHSAMLVRIFPYAAINYMAFEQFKRVLIPPDRPEFPLARLVAGSLAGGCSVFFTYPLDVTRTRLAYQVKTHRYHGILNTMRTMYQEGGVRTLYRGFVPTLLGIFPYAGISFYSYDTLKIYLRTHWPDRTLNAEGDLWTSYQLGAGAVAGAAAQTVAYPLDVVRRRMQLLGMSSAIPDYKSTLDAFRSILASEGWRGLFIGVSINYFKVVPATALSFASYEFMKKQLGIA